MCSFCRCESKSNRWTGKAYSKPCSSGPYARSSARTAAASSTNDSREALLMTEENRFRVTRVKPVAPAARLRLTARGVEYVGRVSSPGETRDSPQLDPPSRHPVAQSSPIAGGVMRAYRFAAAMCTFVVGAGAWAREDDDRGAEHGRPRFVVRTLSTRPELVSGGDALVEISIPRKADRVVVSLNGRDISNTFRAGQRADTLLGLVTGLALGSNRL